MIDYEAISRLEALAQKAQNIAYQAQQAAEDLREAAKSMQDAVKRAKEEARPINVLPPKLREESGKPTANSHSARCILFVLAATSKGWVAGRSTLTSLTGLASSTIRAYLPLLVRAGLVSEHEHGGIEITDAGRASLS